MPLVAASIRRLGWQQPIVANRSDEIIAGNTRRKVRIDPVDQRRVATQIVRCGPFVRRA